MILLDTDVLIDYLRGTSSVVNRLKAAHRSEVGIPAIAAYELEYGTRTASAKRRTFIEIMFRSLQLVPFDLRAARAAADIRGELEHRGFTIGPLDLMIAGTALSRNAVLVTANTREFKRIKRLRIEDWTV